MTQSALSKLPIKFARTPAEPIRPGKGRELRSLIGIHDLGRAELVDGIAER